MKLRPTITCLLLLLVVMTAKGQITIGGNVYGGGNHAEVKGSTKVTVRAGDIGAVLDPDAKRPIDDPRGKVFGGARAANVGGNTFVHIDGENASDYIVINQVFGGSDVAGTIGTAKAVSEDVPKELTAVKRTEGDKTDPKKDDVDVTWNSYVRISNNDAKKIFIGQVYAGGNGDFEYKRSEPDEDGNVTHTICNWDSNIPIATMVTKANEVGFHQPSIDKAYLDVEGGTISFAYGGGNNTTVNDTTVIHVDNPSKVVTHILVDSNTGKEAGTAIYNEYENLLDNDNDNDDVPPAGYTDLLNDDRFKEMGINTVFDSTKNADFQVSRFYGGNNTAEMSIQPGWNLLSGKIRNLYSGGNRGRMTCRRGLLLEIPTYSTLVADNVYGGCRMADVRPMKNGANTTAESIPGYFFPTGFSARVLIRGGDINNVYGGNDVTGTVYGGNAVGVYTSIRGDIYGGGNGAYAYTNNEDLAKDKAYGDFYYEGSTEALKAFRPNAEQVSIRLRGTDADHPTVIKGSVYLGGNCASLATTNISNPKVELKMGSHVIVNNVYLGNNGAGMIDPDYLKFYAGDIDENGEYTERGGGTQYSDMDLTNKSVMAEYMDAVTMTLQPSIVFDKELNGDPADYADYSSSIGSFYCGGNVGSMAIAGKNTYHVNRGMNIFEKFVGGCNNADVAAGPYNAAFEGGVLGTEDERSSFTDAGGNIKDRLEINFENLTITPMRWNADSTGLVWNTQKWGNIYTALEDGTELEEGDVYYDSWPYTNHTVTGSAYTVTKDDKCFRKVDDNVYVSIATGTKLPVDSKYYKLEGTKKTVTDAGHTAVEGEYLEEQDFVEVPNSPIDKDVRLLGGNIYGGCYNSGHVNGNVVININADVIQKDKIFGAANSGVELEDQRDDLMAVAMSVFGAGYGEDTEIWGSTTVNHNNGYAFQIYGGGEQGVVGKQREVKDEHGVVTGTEYYYDPAYSSTVNLNGASAIYSSDGTASDLAETEYIYGGGNEGDVWGNTYVNLGNGRVYDAFGGASDADVRGHTEVIIGRQPNGSGGYKPGFPWVRDIVYGGNDFGGTIWGEYVDDYDYEPRIRNYETYKTQMHGYAEGKHDYLLKAAAYVEYLQGRVDTIFGGSYGSYDYTNKELYGINSKMPRQEGAFVNIRPEANARNQVNAVFGAGTGYPGNREDDEAQDHSYVLIDIPDDESIPETTRKRFADMQVFGAGSYNGVGMREKGKVTFAPGYDRDKCSAVVDLLHGEIGNAYGGSFNEGNTCRSVVNVPAESTIKIGNIFGGAFGTQILPPCDVIQTIVNYNNTSEKAAVTGALYGGNNNERRSVFTQVNISSPVWSDKTKGKLGKAFGAGKGIDTWSEHTLVNLLKGAKIYEVYGGGEMGHVLNAESVQKYMQLYKDGPSPQISAQDPYWKVHKDDLAAGGETQTAAKEHWAKDWQDAWKLGHYYAPNDDYNNYFDTFVGLRGTSLVYKADIDERDFSQFPDTAKAKRQYVYSTNVVINEGAEVVNYAYGGGYGTADQHLSGDVYGHTYIALLGGTVGKDIYAAGTAGAVNDIFGVGAYYYNTNDKEDPYNNPYGFTASTTAYIKGGTCRNVYGGGWKGNVGKHTKIVDGNSVNAEISDSPDGDIAGSTYVIIGDMGGSSFTNGIPAIQRNVYGGGEGGAVYGTAHVMVNNGYIGYVHLNKDEAQDNVTGQIVASTGTKERYEEKIIDETWKNSQTGLFEPNTNLTDAGCVFGGGYIDNSSVDKTSIVLNGGEVRNSVFGGGEVAAIGRGTMSKSGSTYTLTGLYRPGNTHIEMYSGHVHRNVFGGGRGYDNLGRIGSLNCPGYVFGQTEVHVHGGEVGTAAGLTSGDGNVFGGCDIGHVYSAYEITPTTFGKGVKAGVRYNEGLTSSDPGWNYQGYYYQHDWNGGDFVTENIYYTQAEIDAAQVGDPAYGKTTLDVKKTERQFTEDCKVLIEPMCKVLNNVTIDNTEYSPGQFVPIAKLNMLKDKNSDADKWSCLDDAGIIIHNGVFAGGNTLPGSTTTSANTVTVFGNATASIHDVYHRDLITLGTRHTGGLYGDGNLTLVDGYRELNITNYGTDYYTIAKEITIDQYHALPEREAAYYELKYTCLKTCVDNDGTRYNPAVIENGEVKSKASTITADDFFTLFKDKVYDGNPMIVVDNDKNSPNYGQNIPNKDYWQESGVLPVYAGRLMNSIQRADFCGVFGSRMVMQGAQDRVPDEVDFTNYTINRVREVSLNKMDSKIASDIAIAEGDAEYYKKHTHGNYFGIYSVVNYLGALTSDVKFTAPRKTENTNTETYGPEKDSGGNVIGDDLTYYDWKKKYVREKKRNNGSSHNKLALASGVFLEITTEESTGDGLYEKVWGPITGVIELDLINVSPGIGGGFVYAKNIHGEPSVTSNKNTTLTELNDDAVTQWDYDYIETNTTGAASSTQHEWETSGNFVHSTQTIIDDCYNVSNRYLLGQSQSPMPAHYWYIKGTTYVYDQYISAYTGQSNAFSEVVEIPLTIAAASHGKMKLLNVQPNRYAFYSSPGVELGQGKKMIINDKEYYKNDPISYWDWYLLSKSERELFVEKTYTNCISVSINDGTVYEPGTLVMRDTEYDAYDSEDKYTYKDAEGNIILDANKNPVRKDYIFRESNNVSHGTGYLLTYEVNNPSLWDTWYTLKTGTGKKSTTEYGKLTSGKEDYEDGPTYRLKASSGGTMLGQQTYTEGDIISQNIETTYKAVVNAGYQLPSGQATFEPAYLVTEKLSVTEEGKEHHYNVGVAVSETFKTKNTSGSYDKAYICTKTVEISKDDVIYRDSKMTETEWQTLYDKYKNGTEAEQKLAAELKANIVPAYICTVAGLYGGNYYVAGTNYRGLEAWSSMSKTDREKFTFNYDALDLLIDPLYSKDTNGETIHSEGQKYQYDSEAGTETGANANPAHYSLETPVDYTATYNGRTGDKTETEVGDRNGQKYMETTVVSSGKVYVGDELTREQFEALPNEQRHYSPIAVKETGSTHPYYVVKTAFQIGSTPYAVGETISSDTYASLPTDEKKNVTELVFGSAYENTTVYYCREEYERATTVNSISATKVTGAGPGYDDYEKKVKFGTLIEKSQYDDLPNEQKNFTIHGISPTETSTFYVSRESDIYNLSKDKIITVIYQYDYEETDGSGNVTPVSERHVLNIHLQFKSGVPVVDDILKPDIILPGWFITMREPEVTPGAYEVTGGGWELFETLPDAERHTNGTDYDPNEDPLYWYQDSFYVAYYAKTYLGRTYSNSVPVRVANYHDLADVMSDKNKTHHMYIDHTGVKRDSKIYINDYSASKQNGLDLFKNLYDLSISTSVAGSGDLEGHALLNSRVLGGSHLEFFMRTDIDHSDNPWTPIASGDSDPCFNGNFHGDGHTISGLNPAPGTTGSLFGKLCGNVYNLGVMGSFTGAGIADTGDGYVESCWTKTSAAAVGVQPDYAPLPTGLTKPYAVFGIPTDGNGYQVVNSYYFVDNKDLYTTAAGDAEITYTNGSKGHVTGKSAQAFYNGELAYDLNNFYLYKRYSDQQGLTSGLAYDYFTIGEDNEPVLHMDGYYELNDNANAKYCSTGTGTASVNTKYVEDRFKDGDFRYAAGEIPETLDERHWIEVIKDDNNREEDRFSPIYPDDYIFFGQKLTYGYDPTQAHQEVPTAVVRDGGRLSLNEDANRVYRAPAYYRNSTMSVAHFNPAAYLAQKSADGTKEAYPGMTAIDFDGHQQGHEKSAYKLGSQDGWFYSPLLDDDGLTAIQNCDETQNLLVYAPAASGESGYVNAQTHGVLTAYFADPDYTSHYDASDKYRRVSENTDVINGHLVQSNLTATNDHLLVDKQDFNAPISYSFDADHLMWYQRKPDLNEYVDHKTGWQGISLPFKAKLVTTHEKGEITHFYSGSTPSANSTEKIGHEYWLREFKDIKEEGTAPDPVVAKASFGYPTATGATGDPKNVTNTFLWDYYYQNTDLHNQKDANADTYLEYQKYYKSTRNYSDYPLLAAATPYILGLPGSMYYEFDLSGKFVAQNTAVEIPQLGKQVITFASDEAVTIGVSDDEMTGNMISYNGHDYTFKPSYLNMDLEAGKDYYTLKPDYDQNNDGVADFSAYEKVPASGDATKVSAFRPYFVGPNASSVRRQTPRYITFVNDDDGQMDEPLSVLDGSLEIFARDHKIIVRSNMSEPTGVSIINTSGLTIANFVIQPGETIETPIRFTGVYIVNRKKLFVK